jgi:hypothetical protein
MSVPSVDTNTRLLAILIHIIIYISMIVWVSVTAWISVGITTHHVNTSRITLCYVILIPLCTDGRTVIYIGKTSVRPPLTSTPSQSGLSRGR